MKILCIIISTIFFLMGCESKNKNRKINYLSDSNVKDYKFYNGIFVDAHSQFGPLISIDEVSEKINEVNVDLTLLSFRKRKGLHRIFLKIDKLTNNKVRYLIPTKLAGFTRGAPVNKVIGIIKKLKRNADKSNINYVGYGEIIIQHAPHDHKRLKYAGMNLDLNSERISKAIDIVIKDNKPVILHVELNDFESDSKKILNQIITLGNENPNNIFLLIHMAQVEFSEAELILNNTKNVHFITSHSGNEAQNWAKRNKQRISVGKKPYSQHGWINLFNENDKIKTKWQRLMNENPKRFVLALDNVFVHQWMEGYKERVLMWRKALASLERATANSIACQNANQYFQLNISCETGSSHNF